MLEGGIRSGLKAPAVAEAPLPALDTISAADLKRALDAGTCAVFDLGASMSFRKSHIPGSRWSTRVRLAADAGNWEKPVVLVAEEADVARLAATGLFEAGIKDVKLLESGIAAWANAGYATEATPDSPADAECIDHLFFVHDRHAGNKAAMRQYLAWETGLIAQLDEQDKASFRIGAPR